MIFTDWLKIEYYLLFRPKKTDLTIYKCFRTVYMFQKNFKAKITPTRCNNVPINRWPDSQYRNFQGTITEQRTGFSMWKYVKITSKYLSLPTQTVRFEYWIGRRADAFGRKSNPRRSNFAGAGPLHQFASSTWQTIKFAMQKKIYEGYSFAFIFSPFPFSRLVAESTFLILSTGTFWIHLYHGRFSPRHLASTATL